MKRQAPWPDYAGNPIYEGDLIRHPLGETGKVVFVPTEEDQSSQWRVAYGDGMLSRLGLQIGDKGQAVVIDAARLAGRDGE